MRRARRSIRSYTTTTSEATRCHFCKNDCLRTFIDVAVGHHEHHQGEVDTELSAQGSYKSKVALAPGARRLIVGNSCEKGLVEDVEAMREIKKELDAALGASPNLMSAAAKAVFKSLKPEVVADPPPKVRFTAEQKQRAELVEKRKTMRIGIPRVLNAYSTNPLFSAYFESLGVPARNLVYSDFSSEELRVFNEE